MKKRFLSLLMCFCLCVTMMPMTASAAATKIDVTKATYYSSGDVKDLTIDFGWDTASAASRLTVMTKKLRSAGEAGTDKYYGDFTDFGYYGSSFKNWSAVLAKSSDFGMLYYTDEQKITSGKTNTISVSFDEGDIPLDVNKTYYLYLWTYYGGQYYPDNLFMVLQVKNGKFQFAPATDRNSYGSFTTLKELTKAPASTTTTTTTKTSATSGAPSAAKFTDVKSGDYFAAPVAWAVSQGITSGTTSTTFSPNSYCTRAQILTFLWRAAGSPQSTAFLINPYTDISEDAYYYQAALWAKERGMVDGIKFSPNTNCTRGDTVMYFWKYDGYKSVTNVPFSDVAAGKDLAKAVSWAVTKGITSGTGGSTFSPSSICTRGQIATFLHRYFVAPMDNSDLIKDLSKPAASTTTTSMKLDPLPPKDYLKHPDWYGTLTPIDKLSDERLVAEYNNLNQYMKTMSDSTLPTLVRRDDLWYAIMYRGIEDLFYAKYKH